MYFKNVVVDSGHAVVVNRIKNPDTVNISVYGEHHIAMLDEESAVQLAESILACVRSKP